MLGVSMDEEPSAPPLQVDSSTCLDEGYPHPGFETDSVGSGTCVQSSRMRVLGETALTKASQESDVFLASGPGRGEEVDEDGDLVPT